MFLLRFTQSHLLCSVLGGAQTSFQHKTGPPYDGARTGSDTRALQFRSSTTVVTSFAHNGLHFQSLTPPPRRCTFISLQSRRRDSTPAASSLLPCRKSPSIQSLDKQHQVCCGAAVWDGAERSGAVKQQSGFHSSDHGAAALILRTCARLVSLRRSGSGSRCGYLALD